MNIPKKTSEYGDRTSEYGGGRVSMIFVSDIEVEPPSLISNAFKKYTHFSELSTGGKARLVSCKDTNLGRRVVLKMLREEFFGRRSGASTLDSRSQDHGTTATSGYRPYVRIGQDDNVHWFLR